MDESLYDIAELMKRSLQGDLTVEDQGQLDRVLAASPEYRALLVQLKDGSLLHDDFRRFSMIDSVAASEKILLTLNNKRATHRVHFLKTTWLRYAAAVILAFGVGAYLWNTNPKTDNPVVQQTKPVPSKNDFRPGGNHATLTLADGSSIVLDSAGYGSGPILKEGLRIENDAVHGIVAYTPTAGGFAREVHTNFLQTPNGGQYTLRLSDGTKVWLNAASSITFPSVFDSNKRVVSIAGEAYFEVAKDTRHPFIVTVGDASVEVLGTHFNVNAYANEPVMKTTLLEGKVRVRKGGKAVQLVPGQQAMVSEQIRVDRRANAQSAVAWKNGFFDLQDKKLSAVMREIARWYDVEVVFGAGVKDVEFVGNISRHLQLSQVLQGLSQEGVHFQLNGHRQLLIQP